MVVVVAIIGPMTSGVRRRRSPARPTAETPSMLVSHRRRFIFTKTVKTAGTSLEAYFEPWCLSEGEAFGADCRPQSVGTAGIVGARGSLPVWPLRPRWYNHMPAARIRRLLGREVWDGYFKFTVVRNPFDRLVSAFYFLAAIAPAAGGLNPVPWLLRSERRIPRPPRLGRDDAETVRRFRAWLPHSGWVHDRAAYWIDGRPCVDFFIRYEALRSGLEEVCGRVGVPFEWERLQTLKSQYRSQRIPVRDFYDPVSTAWVQRRYDWELAHFGYAMP